MVGSVALALLVGSPFNAFSGWLMDSTQLSGIMGIKTYKCMNDSKIVVGIIAILELGHMAFVIWDAITMRGVRRLTGKDYSRYTSHHAENTYKAPAYVRVNYVSLGYPSQSKCPRVVS